MYRDVFLVWILFVGLLVYLLVVLWDIGLAKHFVYVDKTKISVLIFCIFSFASIRSGMLCFSLSKEFTYVNVFKDFLFSKADSFEDYLSIDENINSYRALNSIVYRYRRQFKDLSDASPNNIVDPHEKELSDLIDGYYRCNWFIADFVIKLGLVGTILGFIFMLSAIGFGIDNDSGDFQLNLANVSYGMKVALYTTLAGLLSGMLIGLQNIYIENSKNMLSLEIININDTNG